MLTAGEKPGVGRTRSADDASPAAPRRAAAYEDDDGLFEEEVHLDAERPTRPRPSSAVAGGGGSLFQSRAEANARSAALVGACIPQPAATTPAEPPAAATPTAAETAVGMLGVRCPFSTEWSTRRRPISTRCSLVRGLDALLPVLCEAVPAALHEQAIHVLFNASSLKDSSLAAACSNGLVAAMQRTVAATHKAGGMDGLSLALATLTNLAEGCAEGCDHFVRSPEGMRLLVSLVDGRGGSGLSSDARSSAATLLLALCSGPSSPSRQAMLDAGGRNALQAVASATWSSDVVSARAKQALRELA